jgi:hypothetical protein
VSPTRQRLTAEELAARALATEMARVERATAREQARAAREADKDQARAERAAQRAADRPHIAEWFGHRVFPTVANHPASLADQRAHRCPFLSQVAERDRDCVKGPNSIGVCSISATSNGSRQDWLVCPHRALDDDLLHMMIRRLFTLGPEESIHVIPLTNLNDAESRAALAIAVHDPSEPRQFITFQQLFGGEITLPGSKANPEMSFDATIVEVVGCADGTIDLGKYGVIEMQTTDTHGSYKVAVESLAQALNLHQDDFPAQVANHPDWPGRNIEGPNISNVFKRTFYQVMFKFQITRRESSAGCILALPRPVWDSWQPFLGGPDLVALDDGTHALVRPGGNAAAAPVAGPTSNWIYVFDIAEQPAADGSPTPIEVQLIVSTDATTLSSFALDLAPQMAIGDGLGIDSVVEALRRRLANAMVQLG